MFLILFAFSILLFVSKLGVDWGEPQRAPQLCVDLDFRHSRCIYKSSVRPLGFVPAIATIQPKFPRKSRTSTLPSIGFGLTMISSRKDACARALFFVSSPTAPGVQLPFELNSIWIFSTSILSFFTLLSRTRDRRLASEIPLSTLVAVDRLTSFGSVRRRCTKAPRKQPMGGIESSASKRMS